MNDAFGTLEIEPQAPSVVSQDLRQLFLEQLAIMYDSEKQLCKALPLVAKSANSKDLKELLKLHLHDTQKQVHAVEQVAESMEEELPRKKCAAMKSMIRETVVSMVEHRSSPRVDDALIAAAQKIEHYEIAAYGTLCSWAEQLGLEHELALLTSILDQEKIADVLLAKVAQGSKPLTELVQEVSLQKAGQPSRHWNQ